MSSATNIRFGILALVVAVLGGNLLGDLVPCWRKGNEKGVINLPAAAKRNQYSVASANSAYSYGYRMSQIRNGTRLVPPSSMIGCAVVAMNAGMFVNVSVVEGDIFIDGETLMTLRDNDVESFSLRIVDIECDYIEVKFKLTPGLDSYEVLVR